MGRESPDELTLGAEEVGTWKSYINVDHVEKERWRVLPWLIRNGVPSVKPLSKASKEMIGKKCMTPTR